MSVLVSLNAQVTDYDNDGTGAERISELDVNEGNQRLNGSHFQGALENLGAAPWLREDFHGDYASTI